MSGYIEPDIKVSGIFLLGSGPIENSINLLILIAILYLLYRFAADLIRFWRLTRYEFTLFELKPSKSSKNSFKDGEQFFTVLEKMLSARSLSVVSLEITSDVAHGIRYIARVPKTQSDTFKRLVKSFDSALSIIETADYIPRGLSRALDIRVSPREKDKSISHEKYGFIKYLIGALSAVKKDESLTVQYICRGQSGPNFDGHNLRVCIRLSSTAKGHNTDAMESMVNSITSLGLPGRTVKVKRICRLLPEALKYWRLVHRLPSAVSLSDSRITAGEMSVLFRFPSLDSPLLNSVQHKILPLPVSRRSLTGPLISLGENVDDGFKRPIRLTDKERRRHILMVGGTGNGKSTLMLQSMTQDVQNGKGLALIDPHGDLAEELLGRIPKSRLKDVIYFNPADISYPIGINLLELPEGLSKEELITEQDLITEAVISVFRKVFSDNDRGGSRLEYILRNAVHTAFSVKGATLFTVYRLLTDAKFRDAVVFDLKDKTLVNFWTNEFTKAGDMQRVKLTVGITSKLGRFLRSASTRRVLGQRKSAINFDEVLNEGKILVCNLSKGRLGEDTSSVLGVSILTMLQLAAYRRQQLPEHKRSTFNVYVDEFQNFATNSFVQLLSEARKFGLSLTLAEQSISQQDKDIISTILANVGTIVCFRCGSPIDEQILLPLFSPELDKGDLLNLPAYSFYVRIASEQVYPPVSGITAPPKTRKRRGSYEEAVLHSRKAYALSIRSL